MFVVEGGHAETGGSIRPFAVIQSKKCPMGITVGYTYVAFFPPVLQYPQYAALL